MRKSTSWLAGPGRPSPTSHGEKPFPAAVTVPPAGAPGLFRPPEAAHQRRSAMSGAEGGPAPSSPSRRFFKSNSMRARRAVTCLLPGLGHHPPGSMMCANIVRIEHSAALRERGLFFPGHLKSSTVKVVSLVHMRSMTADVLADSMSSV